MGLYDRDYTQNNYRPAYKYSARPPVKFRAPSTIVGRLLLANVIVFLLAFIIPPLGNFIYTWGCIDTFSWKTVLLQPWRIITYQFLHAGFWHIFGNMLVLYFFGPVIERLWGSKKFLTFYLCCGGAGGIIYPFLVFVGWLGPGQMIGASGAVLGVLAATAIMFPMVQVYIYGIFPVRLIFLALILLGISVMTLLRPDNFANAGGEAAHLAGMAVGALYVLWPIIKTKLKFRTVGVKWQRRRQNQQQILNEADRILEKVHTQGIHRLSRREKQILREATKLQQHNKI